MITREEYDKAWGVIKAYEMQKRNILTAKVGDKIILEKELHSTKKITRGNVYDIVDIYYGRPVIFDDFGKRRVIKGNSFNQWAFYES